MHLPFVAKGAPEVPLFPIYGELGKIVQEVGAELPKITVQITLKNWPFSPHLREVLVPVSYDSDRATCFAVDEQ